MASKKKEQLSYSQASKRLETILQEIETGEADVDELSARVEEGAALIHLCREKLSSTELKVKKVVDALVEGEEAREKEG
jgi:exodeoxyribonuclease VII small subunit